MFELSELIIPRSSSLHDCNNDAELYACVIRLLANLESLGWNIFSQSNKSILETIRNSDLAYLY